MCYIKQKKLFSSCFTCKCINRILLCYILWYLLNLFVLEGTRNRKTNFSVKTEIFLYTCQTASNHTHRPYYLIACSDFPGITGTRHQIKRKPKINHDPDNARLILLYSGRRLTSPRRSGRFYYQIRRWDDLRFTGI